MDKMMPEVLSLPPLNRKSRKMKVFVSNIVGAWNWSVLRRANKDPGRDRSFLHPLHLLVYECYVFLSIGLGTSDGGEGVYANLEKA
jgi:hypothetical protein